MIIFDSLKTDPEKTAAALAQAKIDLEKGLTEAKIVRQRKIENDRESKASAATELANARAKEHARKIKEANTHFKNIGISNSQRRQSLAFERFAARLFLTITEPLASIAFVARARAVRSAFVENYSNLVAKTRRPEIEYLNPNSIQDQHTLRFVSSNRDEVLF